MRQGFRGGTCLKKYCDRSTSDVCSLPRVRCPDPYCTCSSMDMSQSLLLHGSGFKSLLKQWIVKKNTSLTSNPAYYTLLLYAPLETDWLLRQAGAPSEPSPPIRMPLSAATLLTRWDVSRQLLLCHPHKTLTDQMAASESSRITCSLFTSHSLLSNPSVLQRKSPTLSLNRT